MILNLSTDELWIIATASVCAIACAVPGVFLMLKRSSLLGDAISHAILPGLALAFILTGSRDPLVMAIGALVAGLLTTITASLLRSTGIIKDDAALGIVFTSFFAVGVILITWAAREVDLDPGCVLYGLIEFVPFDTLQLFGSAVPRSFLNLSSIALLNVLLVAIFFKELSISTFDRELASALGFKPKLLDYAMMICVTMTAVAAFEAVGSILVVAMLITPAAAAFLLFSRLSSVLIGAACIGIFSAIGGYAGALSLNTSVAGMMSVTAACVFILVLVLSPSHGVVAHELRQLKLRHGILRDDILGMLYRWHEVVGRDQRSPLTPTDVLSALGFPLLTRNALRSLLREGAVVKAASGALHLTERGILEAAAVVRSHRLWEAYLAKHLGLPRDHLHAPSERTEHFIGRALAREIQEDISASKDPHGRSIP